MVYKKVRVDVLMLIRDLYRILKDEGLDIEDPAEKYSHENKTLLQHVEETINICRRFLKFYNLEQFAEFVEILCAVHDLGKLHPDWSIRGRKISHVTASLDLLNVHKVRHELSDKLHGISNSVNIPLNALFDFILYFTRIHHSFINAESVRKHPKAKEFVRKCASSILGLVDSYGIFKFADIISASYYNEELIDFLSKYVREYQYGKTINRLQLIITEKCSSRGIRFDEQKFLEQKKNAEKPGIHVLIAPTGWGKTAYSLMKAIYEKPTKIFYILPTITAIRSFYEDLKNIFNDDVGEYFYFVDIELLSKKEEMDPSDYVRLLDTYRFFIPKINITTIDQVFLSLLNFRKYHLRRFCFRGSFLILDEFHLLTPEMIQFLKALIDIYGNEYKFKLLFMSATPSLVYIDYLKESIERNIGLELVFPMENYERLYEKLRRHKLDLWLDKKILDDEVLEAIIDECTKMHRVLIIVNTVDRAIDVYKELRERLKDIMNDNEIVLIHSRFAVKDRMEREKTISNAKVLVTTQVAEVSLDVSFDYLFTELAPIPSLIQRFGRVNRYSERKIGIENNVTIVDVPTPDPYTASDLGTAKRLLHHYINDINDKGEKVYIDMIQKYDDHIKKRLNECKKVYDIALYALYENSKLFYAFREEEGEAIRIWRRETNVLGIPEYYASRVRVLKEKMLRIRDYPMRRKILAEIKSYFIPVPWYIAKNNFDLELGMFVIPSDKFPYDPYLGLLIKDYRSSNLDNPC